MRHGRRRHGDAQLLRRAPQPGPTIRDGLRLVLARTVGWLQLKIEIANRGDGSENFSLPWDRA
jgi:hypothetical protein